MLGVKRYEVALSKYDDSWKKEYLSTRNELSEILRDNVIEIRHVGSTAIKGIVAKPILDVAVVIKSVDALNVNGMIKAGYEYLGEHGGLGRYLFVRRIDGDISTHHIHCYLENHENFFTTVLFCKYLNSNSEYAKQYNDLKIELAEKYATDRNAYTEAKAVFIERIIALAKDSGMTI